MQMPRDANTLVCAHAWDAHTCLQTLVAEAPEVLLATVLVVSADVPHDCLGLVLRSRGSRLVLRSRVVVILGMALMLRSRVGVLLGMVLVVGVLLGVGLGLLDVRDDFEEVPLVSTSMARMILRMVVMT